MIGAALIFIIWLLIMITWEVNEINNKIEDGE